MGEGAVYLVDYTKTSKVHQFMKITEPNNSTNSKNCTCQKLKCVMCKHINVSWKQSTIINDISPQNYTLGCTLTLLTQKIVTNGIFACCHVVCHTSSSPRSHYSLIKGNYYFSLLDINLEHKYHKKCLRYCLCLIRNCIDRFLCYNCN